MDITALLKNYLDANGRLTKYPSKHRLKILSLFYLASKIAPNVRYSEKQINELLKQWHTFDDWAMLRRDLYDRRFLGRAKDGSFYWVEEKKPTMQDFGLEL